VRAAFAVTSALLNLATFSAPWRWSDSSAGASRSRHALGKNARITRAGVHGERRTYRTGDGALSDEVTPANSVGSTSRITAVCLAVGRFDELPEPYTDPEEAWARLNLAQRKVVREFNLFFRDPSWDTPVHYA
jgi:hypothetical protein